MSVDDPTPARTPSSMRIQTWGLVQAWLATKRGRGVVLTVDEEGFRVTVIDPDDGQTAELVGENEDPSRATLRATSKLAYQKD